VLVWEPPVPRETMRVVSPSAVSGGSAPLAAPRTAAPDDEDPTERGHRVHLLLQLATETGVMVHGHGAHWDEAAAVFGDSALAWVFHPESEGGRGLSEVPIIHRRQGRTQDGVEERLTGVIDRLVVWPDRVEIVDYKTNRFGGDPELRRNLVEHYRPQLASYAEAVACLYPGRQIRTWLLFTEPGLPGDQRLAEVQS